MPPFRFAVQVSSLPLPGWRERVFDPSFNYAHPEGSPVLPGDSGDGSADRYLEALSESVIRPLAGQ